LISVCGRGAAHVAVAVWHSLPGTVLLYGAACIHIALAFVALYEHRTLRMPPMELLRIVLGFGIPTLLIAHAVTTRLAFEAYGAQSDYARVVWMLWHSNRECRQMALLVPGWLHGCLGLNLAFGRRVWFQRLRLVLFGAALLLPILATLGFLAMLKEVSILAQDPAWFSAHVLSLDAAQTDKLARTSDGMLVLYFALIGAVFAARIVRHIVDSYRGMLSRSPIRAPRVPRGWTVLSGSCASHSTSFVCGGRARCSTCRVRVVAGGDRARHRDRTSSIPQSDPRSEGTRLACQLRPERISP
jgi:adenylate cyclase